MPKGKLGLVGSASASPLAEVSELSEVSADAGRVEVAKVVTRPEASVCV